MRTNVDIVLSANGGLCQSDCWKFCRWTWSYVDIVLSPYEGLFQTVCRKLCRWMQTNVDVILGANRGLCQSACWKFCRWTWSNVDIVLSPYEGLFQTVCRKLCRWMRSMLTLSSLRKRPLPLALLTAGAMAAPYLLKAEECFVLELLIDTSLYVKQRYMYVVKIMHFWRLCSRHSIYLETVVTVNLNSILCLSFKILLNCENPRSL
jgi:hypothetical protein